MVWMTVCTNNNVYIIKWYFALCKLHQNCIFFPCSTCINNDTTPALPGVLWWCIPHKSDTAGGSEAIVFICTTISTLQYYHLAGHDADSYSLSYYILFLTFFNCKKSIWIWYRIKSCKESLGKKFSWETFQCDASCNFMPFRQFKKREKHPWRSDAFRKVAGFYK